jgi:nitrogen regulatory protein PII
MVTEAKMLSRRILFVIAVAYLALCSLSAQAQQKAEETISLNGINLSLGVQKSEVMDLLGKKYLLEHYGGKEDIWRIFKREGKYRAGTVGSMVAQVTFKDGKTSDIFIKRGNNISSLLTVLEEYNKRGQVNATIKTNFLGHGRINDSNETVTGQSIVMDFGKKYIIVIVTTLKDQPEITEVNEVMGE